MIVPPTTLGAGRSVLDVIAQAARPNPAVAVAPTAALPSVTEHALLVLLGKFAQHLGLIRLLEAVPIPQKTRDHRPQTKLIQFLIGILAGLDYLQDFSAGACPVGADAAVIASWGQAAFAHYSGISRTLAAADATTLQAVVAALQQVSQPFLERDVLHILRSGQPLVVDIDLTGRPVSPTSTDYPDAAFGWMDDAVAKGYQAAISSLSGAPQGRVLLNTQRYGGRTKSAECLRAAVVAVEQTLGLRPRRRTALVQAQVTTLHARVQDTEQRLATVRDQLQELTWQHDRYFQGVKMPSARAVQQQTRRVQQIARTRQQLSTLIQHHAHLQAQQSVLETWLAHLEADNTGGSSLAPIVIRLDAGFATDANLAYLIELGYTVLTKVHSGHTTSRLQRSLGDATVWERVGTNAEAVALGAQRIGEGRYALQALQVRYQVAEGLRHTTLLYYDDAPPPSPVAWFAHYNGRQVLEAGIKENKGVFSMRRPLVRSAYGMQIQEQFALFAANLVRWAAEWARDQIADAPPALARALSAVKTLVRVVAHSRAWLVETEMGCGLVFDTHSPFAGAVLRISGQVVFQTVLPFVTSDRTTVQQVT
jgi:hypothetical protein